MAVGPFLPWFFASLCSLGPVGHAVSATDSNQAIELVVTAGRPLHLRLESQIGVKRVGQPIRNQYMMGFAAGPARRFVPPAARRSQGPRAPDGPHAARLPGNTGRSTPSVAPSGQVSSAHPHGILTRRGAGESRGR